MSSMDRSEECRISSCITLNSVPTLLRSRGPDRWPGQSGKEPQSHNLLFLLNVTDSSLEVLRKSGEKYAIRYAFRFPGSSPLAECICVISRAPSTFSAPDPPC